MEMKPQKRSEIKLVGSDLTFLGTVLLPSTVITLFKVILELVFRFPGTGNLTSILIENALFFAMLLVTAFCVFVILKRKIKKLDSAPQSNFFLPATEFDRFRPIDMRTPADYPFHKEFASTAKSLKMMRYLLLFSTGGMALISITSMFTGMSFHNMLFFAGFVLLLILPVLYINAVLRAVEESLRENSFHLAHSDIFELELLSIVRDLSQQHMMYKLEFKMGNTLKNYHIRPMKESEKNFSELKLQNENCPQNVSVYINPVSGEPLALATQNGPVWLSNAEVRMMFMPPKKGEKMLSLARPIVPLEYDKGIKLLADKSFKGSKDDIYLGNWNGLYSFDNNPRMLCTCSIRLASAPTGGLWGTYHSKLLGPLYGKVTVSGKSVQNELYLEIIYHFWLWKIFEKPELWAGIYDPETKKITGTIKKGNLNGNFVLARDCQ
ncbi:MAG: hypothetical protein SFY67_11375 [Candidatus Melainabacteria bacterium]|nr:hypothetical protein [Candidatus Melainabacteria bacterium]